MVTDFHTYFINWLVVMNLIGINSYFLDICLGLGIEQDSIEFSFKNFVCVYVYACMCVNVYVCFGKEVWARKQASCKQWKYKHYECCERQSLGTPGLLLSSLFFARFFWLNSTQLSGSRVNVTFSAKPLPTFDNPVNDFI